MPKIVDHQERRRQIVEAVWALIARRGLDAVTMRDLAAEAGYSNGALAPYFRNKDEILQAAFTFAFESTNTRAEDAIAGASGLASCAGSAWRSCRWTRYGSWRPAWSSPSGTARSTTSA